MDQRLEKQVEQWIASHRDELVGDIQKLIRIRSVAEPVEGLPGFGAGCTEALKAMLALGKQYGFAVENDQNYCGSILWDNGGKTIGAWGHLDVVPEGNDWIYPPYEGTVVGDFLIGRGSQDNKGPSVTALYAIRCLKELGIPLKNSIRQIVGCQEESGMKDVEYYLEHHSAPDFSIVTDCGFPVCYGEKGIFEAYINADESFEQVVSLTGGTVSNIVPDSAELELYCTDAEKLKGLPEDFVITKAGETVKLTAKGMSAHAAGPDAGVNAIAKLCSGVLHAGLVSGVDASLLEFAVRVCGNNYGEGFGAECSDDVSGRMTCVGSTARTENGRLKLGINIRYPIFVEFDQVIGKISRCCQENRFKLQIHSNSKPNYFDRESPFVQALTDTYNRVTGDNKEPYVMGGGTYARKIPNTVAFGPGMDADQSSLNLPAGHGSCHSPDEAQSISSLLKAMRIYIEAFVEMDLLLSECN